MTTKASAEAALKWHKESVGDPKYLGPADKKQYDMICKILRSFIDARGAEGWKLVPVEPTDEMLAATKDAMTEVDRIIALASIRDIALEYKDGKPPIYHAYKAALAAAPAPPHTPDSRLGQAIAKLSSATYKAANTKGLDLSGALAKAGITPEDIFSILRHCSTPAPDEEARRILEEVIEAFSWIKPEDADRDDIIIEGRELLAFLEAARRYLEGGRRAPARLAGLGFQGGSSMEKIKNSTSAEFWIMFFKDPATGSISGSAHGHNCVADYRKNPYFLGYRKITVNMEKLER